MIILDRFEGDQAVLETDDGVRSVPRDCVLADAAEGDVLMLQADGHYVPDAEATADRRQRLQARFQRLIRRNR